MIPARQAARVDPVQALQKGKYQVLSAGESRARAMLAAAARRACRSVCLGFGDSRIAVLRRLRARRSPSALLLGPLLSLALARALRPILKWVRPVEGALAADSLIQSPRRTSASVAAVMLSLALVVAFAGMARASYSSIIDWMDDGAQSGSVRHAVAGHRDPHAAISARDGRRSSQQFPASTRVQMVRDARIIFRKTPGDDRGDRRRKPRGDASRGRRSRATPDGCIARPRRGAG